MLELSEKWVLNEETEVEELRKILRVGYCRVSTGFKPIEAGLKGKALERAIKDVEEEKKKGQTVEQQESFCMRNGVPRANIFSDVVSGTVEPFKRPGWSAMEEALFEFDEAHEGEDIVKEFYVVRLDRISRDQEVMPITVSGLVKNYGFYLNYESKVNYRPETPQEIFLLHLDSYMAAEERRLISERTKARLQQKRLNHEPLGAPEKLSDGDKRLIRSYYNDDGMGCQKIANVLNSEAKRNNRLAANGKPWSVSKITILKYINANYELFPNSPKAVKERERIQGDNANVLAMSEAIDGLNRDIYERVDGSE